ncbi:DUF4062 domain-containing protein [Sorangium sp. So ce542]|uniref:DUF4062 domain-containing protein n=1 Tax=Sorangium sp. So ce542 TaxID=3133316 RepID=UPI003F6204AF
MEKRYQIFVSSTYTDLRDERSKVIQTLMEMDCIPAGMELFPAADEDQWQFIKKVIDDCDYYLLIVGGRYGSVTSEGISYTEMEYDYAAGRGIKVIALIHGAPNDLPVAKSELSPEKLEKLTAFRAKVSSGRLVKFWQNASELPGLVALSLSKTIKTYPAVGWVRANTVANVELLSELNSLRKRNTELEALVRQLRDEAKPAVEDIAGLDEAFSVCGSFSQWEGTKSTSYRWDGSITWREAFGLIAPHLIHPTHDEQASRLLAEAIFKALGNSGLSPSLDNQVFQTIKVQLLAYKLVSLKSHQTVNGGIALFWELTAKGRDLMLAVRTIKSVEGEGA